MGTRLKLTEQKVFLHKLAGEPIRIETEGLKKADLKHIAKLGLWTPDPLLTSNFWKEYGFKVNYPILLIDSDGGLIRLFPGDRHEVLL